MNSTVLKFLNILNKTIVLNTTRRYTRIKIKIIMLKLNAKP